MSLAFLPSFGSSMALNTLTQLIETAILLSSGPSKDQALSHLLLLTAKSWSVMKLKRELESTDTLLLLSPVKSPPFSTGIKTYSSSLRITVSRLERTRTNSSEKREMELW
jgi:hypothetical protein